MITNKFALGFGYGVLATLVMSAAMIIGAVSGMSPMARPIPLAIVATIAGEGTPRLLLIMLAIAAHLIYGGVWAGLMASLYWPVTVWKGVGLGIVLWVVMQIVVLPFLDWGFFGMAVSGAIAPVTLLLHLVYGATYGALMNRFQVVI